MVLARRYESCAAKTIVVESSLRPCARSLSMAVEQGKLYYPGCPPSSESMSLICTCAGISIGIRTFIHIAPLIACRVAELVPVRRSEVVQDGWTTRACGSESARVACFLNTQILTIRVLHGSDLFVVVEIVEERCKDPPACIEFIVSYKVGMIAFKRVEDQRFIRFRDLEVREAAAVGKVEFGHHGLHTQAG